MSEPENAAGITDWAKKLALVGLALSMLLGSIDQTIVATSLPSISTDLGSLDQLFWV